MYLFWHRLRDDEKSEELLEQALLAYCEVAGKREPRKKNRIVSRGEFGKPFYPVLHSVFPSVSHSGDYWAALFDNHPCGVDIEVVTKNHNGGAVIRRRFTPEEQAMFSDATSGGDASLPANASDWAEEKEDAVNLFLRVWTRKEAYLKYTGEGLTRDLRSFSVAEILSDGNTVFRKNMPPFYGEKTAYMQELDFTGAALPLVGAVCGAPGEVQILELPKKDREELLEEAKEHALNYLEAGVHTEAEVRKKLTEKNVSKDITDRVLDYLREYGLVNDETYARRYIELAAEKKKGPVRILGELNRKGIPSELTRTLLRAYEEKEADEAKNETGHGIISEGRKDSFSENALELARKIFEQSNASELDDKLSAKILRRLASRGYTAGDSYDALSDLRREIREQNR